MECQYCCLFQPVIFIHESHKCSCWKFKQWNKLVAQRNTAYCSPLPSFYVFVLILLSEMKMSDSRNQVMLRTDHPLFTAPNCHVLQNSITLYQSSFWIMLYYHWSYVWNERIFDKYNVDLSLSYAQWKSLRTFFSVQLPFRETNIFPRQYKINANIYEEILPTPYCTCIKRNASTLGIGVERVVQCVISTSFQKNGITSSPNIL